MARSGRRRRAADLDVSANPNIASAEFDFPAPQRHDEGDFKWAGYDYPVALPVTFTLKDPAGPATIDAGVFLGVCETICIPVQAKLAVDPASDPDNPDDAAAVVGCLCQHSAGRDARIRREAGGEGAAKRRSFWKPRSPAIPRAPNSSLPATMATSSPRRSGNSATARRFFSVEVTRPDETPAGPGLHYTLVTDAGAVSGLLPYF